MGKSARVQVLLEPEVARALSEYCATHGYKKSTLVARILREFLCQQGVDFSGMSRAGGNSGRLGPSG